MKNSNRFQPRMPRAYWLVLAAASALVLPGAGLTQPASDRAAAESADPANNGRGVSEAEARFRKLGATIRKNKDNEVVEVDLSRNQKITNDDLTHLVRLVWSKGEPEGESYMLPALHLYESNVTDEGLASVGGLKSLRTVTYPHCSDNGLQHLASLKELRFLSVEGDVTGEGFRHLTDLSKLAALYIGQTKITDKGLERIVETHPNISTLVLPPTITDAGIVHTKRLKKLSTLHLRSVDSMTDAGLEHLNSHHSLRKLILGSSKITDEGLQHLKDLKNLQMLATWGNITDEGLENLRGLKNLQRLYLNGARVNGSGFRHLHECPLIQLELNNTGITDAGLAHLEGISGLRFLSLAGAPITDAGLESLRVLIDLETLNLGGTNVTQKGADKLQKALPDCKISLI